MKEALRLALNALKTCQIDGDGWSGPHYYFDSEKVGKAIIAIRQALEQPVATNDTSKDRVDETAKHRHEPEPVAAQKDAVFEASIEFIGTLTGMKPPPIEIAPPETFKPFRDFTEKVCSIFSTSPPKREPLTGQDYADIYQNCSDWDEFARAIEAAHGIKGEA